MASYLKDLKNFYTEFNKILFSKGNINLAAAWKSGVSDLASKRFILGLVSLLIPLPLFTLAMIFIYIIAPLIVVFGRAVSFFRRLKK
ncbi:hypothetical protein [Endozoicomonas sp. ALC066]|uniref:hypothetical protein n=1 Tax=Endozoicomonas sp. ALC066 TaxID=3403078 RepID=UPI003BB55C60